MSLWDDFLSVLKATPGKSIGITIPLGSGYTNPMGNFVHFSDEEVVGLDRELTAMLDMARGRAGIPFIITCGLRTPEQNATLKGAVGDSAHLPDANGKSLAADIACDDDHALFLMLEGLITAGFTRIGIYVKADDSGRWIPRHLHVDCDPTKPQEVTWVLPERNG